MVSFLPESAPERTGIRVCGWFGLLRGRRRFVVVVLLRFGLLGVVVVLLLLLLRFGCGDGGGGKSGCVSRDQRTRRGSTHCVRHSGVGCRAFVEENSVVRRIRRGYMQRPKSRRWVGVFISARERNTHVPFHPPPQHAAACVHYLPIKTQRSGSLCLLI